MLTVKRDVFYCEHCKRHRLTRQSIEHHEPRCIYNPQREFCGWHDDRKPSCDAAALAPQLKQNLDLEWLRNEADGCPACMVAVVVQANLTYAERVDLSFVYEDEIERFRKAEREAVVYW